MLFCLSKQFSEQPSPVQTGLRHEDLLIGPIASNLELLIFGDVLDGKPELQCVKKLLQLSVHAWNLILCECQVVGLEVNHKFWIVNWDPEPPWIEAGEVPLLLLIL